MHHGTVKAASTDGQQQQYVIIHAPLANRIEQQKGIPRMPDVEFVRVLTVEILFTTGFVGVNSKGETIPDNNHFQCLSHVFCHKIPQPIPCDIVSGLLRYLHQMFPDLPKNKN